MPTLSKYVTDDDIAKAKSAIEEIDGELAELVLAEKAGNDVKELRDQLNDTKARLATFINVYEKVDTVTRARKRS